MLSGSHDNPRDTYHNHRHHNNNKKKMVDHFLLVMMMSIISVSMILLFGVPTTFYDNDYVCYVTSWAPSLTTIEGKLLFTSWAKVIQQNYSWSLTSDNVLPLLHCHLLVHLQFIFQLSLFSAKIIITD